MLLELYDTADRFLFIKKYRTFLQQDILFDVGPLLLYLLGIYDNKTDENLLSMYGYSNDDYILLLQLINLFKKSPTNFIITPQILFSVIRHLQYDCEEKYPNNNYCKLVLSKISKSIKPNLKKIKEIYANKDGIISHSNFFGKWKLHSISLDIVDKEKHNCRIILTENHLIKQRFKDDPNILVIPFKDIQNNAYLIPKI